MADQDERQENRRSSSHLSTLGIGGGVVGLSALGLNNEQALEIAKFLVTYLTPAGFVSFLFNVAQGVALYFTIRYFDKRDREKRQDTKEAFKNVRDFTRNVESILTRLLIVLAHKGLIITEESNDVQETVQQKPQSGFSLQRPGKAR